MKDFLIGLSLTVTAAALMGGLVFMPITYGFRINQNSFLGIVVGFVLLMAAMMIVSVRAK